MPRPELSHWRDRIRRCWNGEIAWEAPMAGYTTLKVGGPADALIQPQDQGELVRLIRRLSDEGVPWRVIGRGSNILVADQGVDGVVIVLGRDFAAIRELPGEGEGLRLEVEAGCSLAKLTHWAAARGMSGLEFSVGIPGTVGGAIMMNAGAWGSDIAQVITAVTLLDASGLEQRRLTKDDFCYRGWRQPHGKVVVAGIFALRPDDREAIAERCRRYVRQRAAKQPKAVASAGSFFKNPPGDAAGRLIEEAGLKGTRIGDAEVSTVHANFLVNRGGASATDLRRLMELVQEQVRQRSGIELQPEVKLVGRW